jgi:hypothetical protein
MPRSPWLVYLLLAIATPMALPAPLSARVLALTQSRGPLFGTWSSNIPRTLKSCGSLPEEINVTRYRDLSRPGIYTVWITRRLEPWQHLGKGAVRSNTIAVTVTK